jgi:hypothetical protein
MDMVEKVARALAAASEERWDAKTFSETLSGNDPDEMRASYFFLARAAIAAMREPTEGMVRAVVQYEKDINGSPDYEYTSVAPESAWEIMIDATLTSSEK